MRRAHSAADASMNKMQLQRWHATDFVALHPEFMLNRCAYFVIGARNAVKYSLIAP